MDDQPTLFDALRTPPKKLSSPRDRDTSKAGAESVSMRSGSQKALLLKQYGDDSWLTDDEAAQGAGLLSKIGCCWWHRCSDLRADGLIEVVGTAASPLTGETRVICRITERGQEVLERMGR